MKRALSTFVGIGLPVLFLCAVLFADHAGARTLPAASVARPRTATATQTSAATNTASPNPTLILHWDGSQWSVFNLAYSPTNAVLYAATAVSANDVWAVGSYYDSATGKFRTLTEHWNGTQWNIITSRDPNSVRNNLYGIAAV